jgi:hypothetical protein
MRSSSTWKVGRLVLRPLRVLKRMMRRG